MLLASVPGSYIVGPCPKASTTLALSNPKLGHGTGPHPAAREPLRLVLLEC